MDYGYFCCVSCGSVLLEEERFYINFISSNDGKKNLLNMFTYRCGFTVTCVPTIVLKKLGSKDSHSTLSLLVCVRYLCKHFFITLPVSPLQPQLVLIFCVRVLIVQDSLHTLVDISNTNSDILLQVCYV